MHRPGSPESLLATQNTLKAGVKAGGVCQRTDAHKRIPTFNHLGNCGTIQACDISVQWDTRLAHYSQQLAWRNVDVCQIERADQTVDSSGHSDSAVYSVVSKAETRPSLWDFSFISDLFLNFRKRTEQLSDKNIRGGGGGVVDRNDAV